MTGNPTINPAGDSALLIQFGAQLEFEVNREVLEFDQLLTDRPIAGVTEVSPALVSVLVRFDPCVVSHAALYGHDVGNDLDDIANLTSCSKNDLIDQHSSAVLRVLTLGFAPGCTYLGMLPQQWDLPRLKVINPQVPAGAILVAIRQTVMPSAPMPTGWRCIGQTPHNNFNVNDIPPVAIKHGDEIQYQPVSAREFDRLQVLQSEGESIVERVQ